MVAAQQCPKSRNFISYALPTQCTITPYIVTNHDRRTYYIRDAQGNTLATYSGWVQNSGSGVTWDSFKLAEQHLYGSSRVGYLQPDVKLYPDAPKNPHLPDTSRYPIFEGKKRYELTNLFEI